MPETAPDPQAVLVEARELLQRLHKLAEPHGLAFVALAVLPGQEPIVVRLGAAGDGQVARAGRP